MTEPRDNQTVVKGAMGGAGGRPRFDYTRGRGSTAVVAAPLEAAATASSLNQGSVGLPVGRVTIAVLLVAGAFLVLFRINVSELVYVWSRDSSWSHGFAVPFLALALVYMQCSAGRSAMTPYKWGALGCAALGAMDLVVYITTGMADSPLLGMLKGAGLLALLAGALVGVAEQVVHWAHRNQVAMRPAVAVGLPLMVFGVGAHVLFRVTGMQHMTNLSMLVVLYGGSLLVLGWEYMKVLWLPIGYLVFMINPPTTLYVKLTSPMQSLAAEAGVLLLPLLGVTAERSGTVINVLMPSGAMESLQVAEACSGIRMLLAFVALAVALAYTSHRPMWQKFFLACCAAPVAIACNALRVTLTGVMYVRLGQEWGQGAAHEYLGFLMLVPAMGLQLGMAWLLDRVFVEDDGAGQGTAAAAGTEGGR